MVRLPYTTALTTLFSYGLLFAFGQLRDFFRKFVDWFKAKNVKGYAPICLGLEDFYLRHLYLRIQYMLYIFDLPKKALIMIDSRPVEKWCKDTPMLMYARKTLELSQEL